MKRDLILVYHERLGDVCRCLPLARYFAQQGRRVFIECKPEYHLIFRLVSYALPLAPGLRPNHAEIISLQIWPDRFAEFEASGLNWMDYVYAPWPDCPREIVFDLPNPEAASVPPMVRECALVFPNGYSQRNPPDPQGVLELSEQLFPGVAKGVVGKRELGCYELPNVLQLVAWIAAAKHVLTVNTAPSIIASAVRDSWHHVPDLDPRHDWQHPRAIRVDRLR